jgi:hypothetical protein
MDSLPARVHYSTGRLTGAQAEVVNRWRARLQEARPVAGDRSDARDPRPRASSSDALAAAVASLLAAPPEPLDLVRYADRLHQGLQAAGRAGTDSDLLPVYPPVSFYLPADLADRYEQLREVAYRDALRRRGEIEEEAWRRYPDARGQAGERVAWCLAQMVTAHLPLRIRTVPRGVLARLAIDRWARRSPDRVAAAAVAHAQEVHEQPHRARRDMRQLRR